MRKNKVYIYIAVISLFLCMAAPGVAAELRILYNNDTRGELLTCGCSYDIGGLARKATLLGQVRKQAHNAPVLLLDAGNMLFKSPILPTESGQAEAARIRAQATFAANARMGLRLAGVGSNDLAAGPKFLQKLAGQDFTWLSANLAGPQGTLLFKPATLLQLGQLRVAVLALTSPGNSGNNAGRGYRVRPWQEALPPLLQRLRPQAHLIILLSNFSLEENQKIARTCPELDLIFQSGRGLGNLPPLQAGNALITQTQTRGKYLGLLRINWQGPGRWQAGHAMRGNMSSYSQQFLPLDEKLADHPEIARLVDLAEKKAKAAAW